MKGCSAVCQCAESSAHRRDRGKIARRQVLKDMDPKLVGQVYAVGQADPAPAMVKNELEEEC